MKKMEQIMVLLEYTGTEVKLFLHTHIHFLKLCALTREKHIVRLISSHKCSWMDEQSF